MAPQLMTVFMRISEMKWIRSLQCTLAAVLLVGCSDATTPLPVGVSTDTVTESQLTFLRPATNTALTRDSVSFWAVKGQDREVAMYYRPRAGSSDSARFLRFRVRNESLLRRPDGSTFANGDSIRITLRILDFSKLITQFLPSGLVFSPLRPAELRLDFANCDQDFNRDGSVNASDANLVGRFSIWKQESLGQPWTKLTSAVEISGNLSEVKADVVSFTSHAIAY
jgi:hypothetical protein